MRKINDQKRQLYSGLHINSNPPTPTLRCWIAAALSEQLVERLNIGFRGNCAINDTSMKICTKLDDCIWNQEKTLAAFKMAAVFLKMAACCLFFERLTYNF